MVFKDKSLEQMTSELARIEREVKGRNHPEYKISWVMIDSLRKAINDKIQEDRSLAED
jgi:hypothetical protein